MRFYLILIIIINFYGLCEIFASTIDHGIINRFRRESLSEHFAQTHRQSHSVNRLASMREGGGRRAERSRTQHSQLQPLSGIVDIDKKAQESFHMHHRSLNGVELGPRDLLELPGFRAGSAGAFIDGQQISTAARDSLGRIRR